MKRILAAAAAAMLFSVHPMAAGTQALLNRSKAVSETPMPALSQQSEKVEVSADAPVLSKTSDTLAAARVYEYHPFDANYSGIYINEFYCETTRLMIVADDGKSYLVTDPTPFTNGSLTCTLRYGNNAPMIRSMKVATASQRASSMPAYIMRLSDNAILDDISATFSATFIPAGDVAVTVRDASDSSAPKQKMLIKNGAKIVIRHQMDVSYERLNQLQFTPKYNVDYNALRHDGPAGIESDVMYPDSDYENSTADYCWESLGRICAELNHSDSAVLNYIPKLSTFWTDGLLLKKCSNTSAFIRDFGNADIKANVQLLITNPFVTFDGEETIPHEDIIIYQYHGKGLTDVTNKFRYTRNSDGDGAFVTRTNHLGIYILSSEKVR